MIIISWCITMIWKTTSVSVIEQETVGEVAVVPSSKRIIIERDQVKTYMSVEDYLPGVLACQTDLSFEMEARKSQAVIARTYIYRIMDGRNEIMEEELDLDYLGGSTSLVDFEKEKLAENILLCKEAVENTVGRVMLYEERYILPLFHKINTGRTRTGQEDYPYLQSVESKWDLADSDYLTYTTWTMEDLATTLSISSENLIKGIQVVKQEETGYISQIQVGTKLYQGEELQYALKLESPSYSFAEKDGKILITTRGSGHGYGLSQSGANAMAKEGWSYQDILNYYYQNISIISE